MANLTYLFVIFISIFSTAIISLYIYAQKNILEYTKLVEYILEFADSGNEPNFSYETKKIVENFRKFIKMLQGKMDHEHFLKVKRQNLRMVQELTSYIELCRTFTEVLPYIGILGTVLGFLLTTDLFNGTLENSITGLTLALSSTALALFFAIIIKVLFEARIIPQYMHFENVLQALENHVEQQGGLTKQMAFQFTKEE